MTLASTCTTRETLMSFSAITTSRLSMTRSNANPVTSETGLSPCPAVNNFKDNNTNLRQISSPLNKHSRTKWAPYSHWVSIKIRGVVVMFTRLARLSRSLAAHLTNPIHQQAAPQITTSMCSIKIENLKTKATCKCKTQWTRATNLPSSNRWRLSSPIPSINNRCLCKAHLSSNTVKS